LQDKCATSYVATIKLPLRRTLLLHQLFRLFLQHPDEYRDIGNSIHQRGETTKVCKNTGLKTIAQTIAISRFYLH